ncbi:MAG: CARDB domain-containing protein, partial [Baekduiaceae bacterium]
GHKLRGRLSLDNGDRARATWRLTPLVVRNAPPLPAASPTTNPEPTPDPTTQPTPGGPDLVITEMTGGVVTVKNQGPVATGAFTVRVTDTNGTVRGTTRIDGGLAAGAETTVPYSSPSCEVRYRAVADAQSEVAESDEANNTKDFFFTVC